MSTEAEPGSDGFDIVVNGEPREVASGLTLTGLIEGLDLHPEAVAVELNGLILKRETYVGTVLSQGDRVEVVRFVQGGAQCDPSS